MGKDKLKEQNMDCVSIKKSTILYMIFLYAGIGISQNVYDNFEGGSIVTYNLIYAGKLDTLSANPSPGDLNNSATCAKYTRSGQRYDNIKMIFKNKLTDVSRYAKHTSSQKIKLKIYTTAPVGTLVEIHLGKNSGNAYPVGIHSQFQALTTVSGKWEELEFKFSQIPHGSKTADADVNQITLLFNPYVATVESYYFDDLTGPAQENVISAKDN